MNRILLLGAALCVLAACSPNLKRVQVSEQALRGEEQRQKALAVQLHREREERLVTVTGRLNSAARSLCAEIKETEQCAFPVKLIENQELNATADGESVHVNSGMLRFVENDNELALIVGHEISHNMLRHLDKKRGNAIVGTVVGGLFDIGLAVLGVNTHGAFSRIGTNAGGTAYSQDFEAEADYAGLYLAARAGYDISQAPTLWRRVAVEHPGSIQGSYSATHPGTAERFLALEQAVHEVEAKKQKGLPLRPDQRDEQSIESAETTSPVRQNADQKTEAHSNATMPSVDRKVGRWAFEAERLAMSQGCIGSGGGRPASNLADVPNPEEEVLEVACDVKTMKFQCSIFGCRSLN